MSNGERPSLTRAVKLLSLLLLTIETTNVTAAETILAAYPAAASIAFLIDPDS